MRKSSLRSDQRNPPRATLPPLKCYTLDARRVNVDFEHGLGLRHPRHLRRVELEAKVGLGRAASVFLEVVGAKRRLDHGEKTPQDTVFVQVGDQIQPSLDFDRQCLYFDVRFGGIRGIETHKKKFDQFLRDRRVGGQRLFHVRPAEIKPSLPQVFAVGAQNRDFAPAEICPQHQPIEVVIFNLAAPRPRERFLKPAFHLGNIERDVSRVTHAEIVHINRRLSLGLYLVVKLFKRFDAYVFEHGQA